MAELRAQFPPEFLKRVDENVLFKPLTKEEIVQIADLQIDDMRRRLADRRITVELTPAARELIATEGYDPVYGARPLRRYIQRHVETPIGRALVGGEVEDGSTIIVDVDGGALQFDWGRAAESTQAVGAAA